MAGASNIEGGITISFANMKAITLSADKNTVDIQPGNIWGDVYTTLGKSEKMVIGGRLYNIGIGGLTTGGKFLSSNCSAPHANRLIKVVSHTFPLAMVGLATTSRASM